MTIAIAWDEEHRSREWGRWPNEHLVRFVARHYGEVRDRSEVRFLDVGCGAGANALFLCKEGYGVRAVDVSQAAISRLRERAARDRLDNWLLGAEVFDVSSAENTPWLRPCFDCIVDVACLQCLDDERVKSAVDNVVRLMKPGARFFSYHASAIGWPGVHTTGTVYPRRAHEIVALFGAPLEAAFFHDQHERPHPSEPGRKVIVAHWIVEARKPL